MDSIKTLIPFRLKVACYRSLIFVLKKFVKLMSWSKPTVYCGAGSSLSLCDTISQFGLKRVCIITDATLHEIGMLDPLKAKLAEKNISYMVYDGVDPNPSFAQVKDGLSAAKAHNCDCVLGFGGGSPIDVAKVVALAATDIKAPETFIGLFKAKNTALPLFAIPTTAGTGSEVTIAAVISDPTTHKKNNIIDPKVVPLAVALDPALMVGLPANLTASTGIDTLTHAIEAYLSRMRNPETDSYAEASVRMVFKNLKTAYQDGTNMEAREAMAVASYYGGLAITVAGTGYVHAIAHQLGRFYHMPHGEANALVLPYILKFSKDATTKRLAKLAVVIEAGSESEPEQTLAQKFIDAVVNLNSELQIKNTIQDLKAEDIPTIVTDALKEAHYTYGIPKYIHPSECKTLLLQMAGHTQQ